MKRRKGQSGAWALLALMFAILASLASLSIVEVEPATYIGTVIKKETVAGNRLNRNMLFRVKATNELKAFTFMNNQDGVLAYMILEEGSEYKVYTELSIQWGEYIVKAELHGTD